MLKFAKSDKPVPFAAAGPAVNSTVCRSCGGSVESVGVCRCCARLLVDLALSSVVDEYPRFVEGQPCDLPPQKILRRYAHYEVCMTAAGDPFELGRGAMGITYKATDTHLGCPVALKIINSDQLAGPHGRDRFLHEARTTARLKHPNIASIHHLGLGEDEHCFYAMEYIEGETLDAFVQRQGSLSCEVALNIVSQATRALDVAHRQNFIHRDIKPSNLMLVPSEQTGIGLGKNGPGEITVKIIDFGLVKAINDEENTGWTTLGEGYFAGTPLYAAPEQTTGGKVDATTDIFALGQCLYFMLMGAPPPADPVATTEVQAGLSTTVSPAAASPISVIRPEARKLLSSMTAVDPRQRPQSAEELLQQIQDCFGALHSRETSTAPLHTLQLRRWTGILCLFITVGLSLSGIGFALQHRTVALASRSTNAATLEAQVLFAEGSERRKKLTREDNQAAIELFSKAITMRPDYTEAHAALASAYLQSVYRYGGPTSRLDTALASAQRAIALNPKSPAGFTALGDIRTVEGLHWAALNEYRHALTLDSQYTPAMRGFSKLWSTVGQPQRGLAWGKALAHLEPTRTDNWSAAADACVDLCEDNEAEQCYQHCLEINPVWMSAHCGLLHIHLLQGNFVQARKDCEMTETIDPDLIMPQTLKAQVELFSGNYAAAEPLYRRLLAMKRDGQVHYYGGVSYLSALGFLRHKAGDPLQGDALLAEAEALHFKESEGPQTIYDLAAIRAVQGRVPEALILLERSIASGWMDYRATRLDPRFENLRSEEKFSRLLVALSTHVAELREQSRVLCSKPLLLADYPVSAPGR